ncbi:hypothetical protein JRQ81_019509, partial [Phrynocephalus forsythii]
MAAAAAAPPSPPPPPPPPPPPRRPAAAAAAAAGGPLLAPTSPSSAPSWRGTAPSSTCPSCLSRSWSGSCSRRRSPGSK